MNSVPRAICSAAAVVMLFSTVSGVTADQKSLVAVFGKLAPDTSDLGVIEQVVRDVSQQVIECTVGIRVGAAAGSGVIISPDGYVLTAAHVSGRPGRDVRITLHDGRRVEGKTLGVHTAADGGLIKITSDGTWPFAPLVPLEEAPKVGDWCLAMGHPSGFQAERSAPLRFGRIIEIYRNWMRTDCPLTMGDSGGPLFDVQGRIIGIHSRIGEDVTENIHGPVLAYLDGWQELMEGRIYPLRPASRFLEMLDIDGDGQLTRNELADDFHRRVFDRLVEQFQLDPEKPHSIVDLANEVLEWRQPLVFISGRLERSRDELSDRLASRLLVRGARVRQAFAEIAAGVSQSTVRVKSDDAWAALGTVVSSDGLILTKASVLKENLVCQLPDGREIPASIVEVNDAYDLAMLRIEADGLPFAKWSTAELPIGSWLVTPSADGQVASVGVVSVGARKVERTQAVLGVSVQTDSERAVVERVMPNGGAAEAGIQDGDIIVIIGDKDVGNFEELQRELREFRGGDVVKVVVRRGEQMLELEVTLGAPEDVSFQVGINRMRGPLSQRRDDFPNVVQHDSMLEPTMCGGPVVDLSGMAVGINIARADRVSSYLVPFAAMAEFVSKHVPDEREAEGDEL